MSGTRERPATRRFLIALARAFGGGIFFSLPLFMTMEMWWLSFNMERLRLVLFAILMTPVLIGLTHFAGFEETPKWRDSIRDAFVAQMVGLLMAASLLALFALLTPGMSLDEILGKLLLLSIPASFGATIASSQLGGGSEDSNREKFHSGYGTELFYMAAGALFFAFNVAPTEEMILIAFKMTPWHAIVMALATIAMMHAFVYVVEFRGQESTPEGSSITSVFLRYTVVGFALSLVISAFVLWTFGRFDNSGLGFMAIAMIVLAFPAALGASAARLIF